VGILVVQQAQKILCNWGLIAATIMISFIGFGSGGKNISKHLFLLFIFKRSRAAVLGGRNSNATPARSLNAIGYFTA